MASAPGMNAAILRGVGAPVTPRTLGDLASWNRAEGGSAAFNPFNTTQNFGGATGYNSVGVKNYPSLNAGVRATLQTLNNGRYGGILDALRKGGDPTAFASAVGSSPWGTSGSLLAKVLKTDYQPSSLNTSTKSVGGRYHAAPVNHPGSQTAVANWLMKQSMSLLNGGYGQSPGSLLSLLAQPSQPLPGAPVAPQKASTPIASTTNGVLHLPSEFKATHDTGGLTGFPAIDNFAAAGTPVLSPVSGKLVYSHMLPWDQSKHVGGQTVYLQGDNGKTYFLTHLSGKVPTGRIAAGVPIGDVAAVPNGWWPTHVHEGVYNGIYNPPGA